MSGLLVGDECDAVFYQNLYEIEHAAQSLVHKTEKIRVEQWIKKLLEPCSILTWKKSRNRYSELLLIKSFKAPFDVRPPNGDLPPLPTYMLKYIVDYAGEPKRIKTPESKRESTLKKYIREAQLAEFGTADFKPSSTNRSFNSTHNSNNEMNINFNDTYASTNSNNNNYNNNNNTNNRPSVHSSGSERGADSPGPGNHSFGNSALMLSSLQHASSPERRREDEYQEVLDNLERKYVASLRNLDSLTTKDEVNQDSLHEANSTISELKSRLNTTSTELENYKSSNAIMMKNHADQVLKMSITHQREMIALKDQYQLELSKMMPKSVYEALERTITDQKKRTESMERQLQERENQFRDILERRTSTGAMAAHQQESGLVVMLTSQLKEAKEQIKQLQHQIHEMNLHKIAQKQELQQLKDDADQGVAAVESKRSLEQEIEYLNAQLLQKDTDMAKLIHAHRLEVEQIHDMQVSKIESVRREYEAREDTFASNEKRMVQVADDNKRLLEVIRKQERLIEELQEAAEQSNAQKLNNFQQTQAIHKTNKIQIAKLQEELQRLVDDNNALHKALVEEQANYNREIAKMKEEYDKQASSMVTKSVREGMEQTIKGLQQRLTLLESHLNDKNKMHQQELSHANQIHELELSNCITKLQKDLHKQYEDKIHKKQIMSTQDEHKLSHLERVSEEQRQRIAVLEQTITNMQSINRSHLNSSHRVK